MGTSTFVTYQGVSSRNELFLLVGEEHPALMEAGSGTDIAGGTQFDDFLYGQGGRDYIIGNPGDDQIFGDFSADDSLNPRDGAADLLMGAEGSDSLFGATGNDYLSGGNDGDLIQGGVGNDLVYGGAGSDSLSGGLGNDTLYGSSPTSRQTGFFADISADFNGVTDNPLSATVTYSETSIDDGLFGVAPNDASPDSVTGGDGNDKIIGSRGSDSLSGDAGNDTVDGGIGADTLAGGAGDDVLRVDSAGDKVIETATGGADTVEASVSFSGAGQYVEVVKLQGSADIGATGQSLANTLFGNSGDNRLNGAAGNDSLDGGSGADILTGGSGADHFIYRSLSDSRVAHSARDTIADFSHAQGDRIDLSAIDANSIAANDQAFTFIGTNAFGGVRGQLHYAVSGGNILIQGDVNGDQTADFSIVLSHSTVALQATDFLL